MQLLVVLRIRELINVGAAAAVASRREVALRPAHLRPPPCALAPLFGVRCGLAGTGVARE